MKFTAIGFDLDGTLYPNFRLNVRLVPFLLKDLRLLLAMGKARNRLRNYNVNSGDLTGDFYADQARIMEEILSEPAQALRERTERLIYRGWEPHFKEIKLFPHVRETLDAFRGAGIKMGLLSDFPPDAKLKNLKISGYWDTVLCSEETGRLKPDPLPFAELAVKMGVRAESVLYVGNNISYDVDGARRAGMKAALIRARWKKPLFGKIVPDFTFYDYRQLRDYVLS